jgi:hypothetical protein
LDHFVVGFRIARHLIGNLADARQFGLQDSQNDPTGFASGIVVIEQPLGKSLNLDKLKNEELLSHLDGEIYFEFRSSSLLL